MAMLAEPRRKQKFSSDPRNTSWSNDDNKFGHKLMEKMGWSKGKGLGAKEDGNTKHIAVAVKNDCRGVGCSKSYTDNWIAHQDDFNALLANLQEDHTDGKLVETDREKILSLEQTSRTSKGRLHYQKFTKGKDLSLRSETDLDCVFGKRKTQSGNDTPQTQSEPNSDSEEKSHGFITVKSADSVQDYFKKKMAEKLGRLKGNKEFRTVADSSEIDETPDRISSDSNNMEEPHSESVSKKKKKSKKKRRHQEDDDDHSLVVNDCPAEEPVFKKSKKKLKLEDEIHDVVHKKDNRTNTAPLDEVNIKSKKLKHKQNTELETDSVKTLSADTKDIEPVREKTKKKKKDKKQRKELEAATEAKLDNQVTFCIGEDDDSDKGSSGPEKSETRVKTFSHAGISSCSSACKPMKPGRNYTAAKCKSDNTDKSCEKESEIGHDSKAGSDAFRNTQEISVDRAVTVNRNRHVMRKGNVRELPAVKAHEDSFKGANIKNVRGYVGLYVCETDVTKVLSKKEKIGK